MKKLFTLALVLLVANLGYSQVRQVSSSDAKNKVATMQVSKGMESFENVQIEPNMMRTDGELDWTTYDWQSNSGARTWTIVWPDNKINFGYTMATDPSSFADRGTGIGTYDYNNDEWIPLGGRIENEKTGFGSIARYKENGIVVAAHTASNMGVYIVEDKDNMTPNSVPASLYTNNGSYTHPAVMTSGANRDIIHVVCGNFDDSTLPIKYWRSTDGQSWDEAELVLPFIEEAGADWGTNDYYWMETTEDNCLALVVNSAWSDGMVLYSYDDGQTWEKKTFYHHPGVNVDYGEDRVAFLYPRWTSAQWGINGELCMAYSFNGTNSYAGNANSGYYPGIGGVAYWSENLPYHGETQPQFGVDPTNPMPPVPGNPFIMDSSYIMQDIYESWMLFSEQTHDIWPEYMGYLAPLDDDGNPEGPLYDDVTGWNIEDLTKHGPYNSGSVDFPVLCLLPDCGGYDMVAVWSGMDENHMDANTGNFFYKLFASYSGDGGRTWAHQIQLTNDFMYDLSECVYPQAAVIGTTLVIAVQMDGAPGTFVQSDDTEAGDNYYQGLTFELNDLFPDAGVGVPEVSHNTHMSIYPNPATDQIGVTLSQNADITIYNMMGQVVMTTEGHAGVNSINISNLTAGIYFVNAGTETQKIVVK
ncbi:MAG: hypothetical protein F082_10 [bacterium F082]|nr:MAG: hypothetical protein F082_10 [bacterium F082]KWW31761.1 MAG: hypothetical protein AUK64_10 [bacterium P201]